MELLVGIAVGAVFVVGMATIVAPSLGANKQAAKVQEQAELGEDLMESVRAWANGNWNSVLALATGTANWYYLNTSSSPFLAVGPGTGQLMSSCSGNATATTCITYLRYFYLSDVYRDASGNATSVSSGNYYDPSTKLVTVTIGISSSTVPPLTYPFYITRNGDNAVSQTNWSGGAGQSSPLTVIGTTFASSSNITISATGSIQLTNGGSACIL